MGPSPSDDIAHLRSLTARLEEVAGEIPGESSLGQLASQVGAKPRRSTWMSLAVLAAWVVGLLVPSATIGAMVWQGVLRTPWSKNVALGHDSQSPSASLTTPRSIEAERGKEVPFKVTLYSVHPLPVRTIVIVQGLPEGTTLSRGQSYGETEWSLGPDELGDLRLLLPETASGHANLSVRLVGADGTIIARASTQLSIVAAREPPLISRPDEMGRIADLMEHGQKMLDLGQIAQARGYFKRAAEAGSPDAAYALGRTYDPSFLSDAGVQGMKADPAEARAWYERAMELGSEAAKEKLQELRHVVSGRLKG